MTSFASGVGVGVQEALREIEREKAGILPPYLTEQEISDLMKAWTHVYETPGVELENQRFIIDHRLYEEPAFAHLATHPTIQEAVRNAIGDFQLAGYSMVATPTNGTEPMQVQNVPFHIDHSVYSNVPVSQARDTFVCVWVNFEELAIENGPFVLAVGSHAFNMGYPEATAQFGKAHGTAGEFGWDRLARFNIGPAGTTAVYSGKTWHSASTNCSSKMRKGLNMNFVPKDARDSTKRNRFDLCALSHDRYLNLQRLVGIPDYLIPWDAQMAAAGQAAPES